MIRVVAIEDDARYRASLETLLRHSNDFSLIRSFATPGAALSELQTGLNRGTPPDWDLVLMDLGLPEMSGIECTRRIKQVLPDTAVVALTVFEERDTILEAICAGADGYLLKRTPADRLLMQLRDVIAGGSPLSAGIARTVLDLLRHLNPGADAQPSAEGSHIDLTDREEDVLRCLVQGMSYKRAARHLGISIDTLRTHIRHVYRKLQVHSVAEAVSRTLREGLI